jgi:hypothetical protein
MSFRKQTIEKCQHNIFEVGNNSLDLDSVGCLGNFKCQIIIFRNGKFSDKKYRDAKGFEERDQEQKGAIWTGYSKDLKNKNKRREYNNMDRRTKRTISGTNEYLLDTKKNSEKL